MPMGVSSAVTDIITESVGSGIANTSYVLEPSVRSDLNAAAERVLGHGDDKNGIGVWIVIFGQQTGSFHVKLHVSERRITIGHGPGSPIVVNFGHDVEEEYDRIVCSTEFLVLSVNE